MDKKDVQEVGSYPIQSRVFTPHPNPRSDASGDEHRRRLPKSIRALRDSREANHQPRTVVVCLDGTGDQFDGDNSNIVHFVSCLKKHSPAEQVTYYQPGIGTYTEGGLQNGIRAAMDMAVGSGLGETERKGAGLRLTWMLGRHVRDAYKFLMQNYEDGDRICLLGFSRGAYTIRCLAGMLHKVGLLPASNRSQVNFAYKFYKDDSPKGQLMSAEFKRTFCTNVNLYFVGLWDCVASVGFIPRTLPLSKSPTNSIYHFRHAMALNEHRAKFQVCQWQNENPDLASDVKRRATVDQTPTGQLKRSGLSNWLPIGKHSKTAQTNGTGSTAFASKDQQEALDAKFEAQYEATRRHLAIETDVLEVWFMGAHADVGGGAVKNDARHALSRIPLRWMIRQCFECNTGILFDAVCLAEKGIDIHTLWPEYQTPSKPAIGPPPALIEKYEKKTLAPLQKRATFLRIGPEEDTIQGAPTAEDLQYILPSESTEDHFDSMARLNDQLHDAKGWWILELWPVKIRAVAKDKEGWAKKVRMNLGRHRPIRETEPKMHWTVGNMIDEGKYVCNNRALKDLEWIEVV